MGQQAEISTDFPYESKFAKVHGSNLHYIDVGEGDPILFLHGIPTSSYLWRNVIPHVQAQGRCIAVDMIGFGKSDKPDIGYTVFDHINYIETFIQELKLKNVTIVVHGWGSLVGFHYAMTHESNVKGLVFLEAYLRPINNPGMVTLPIQEITAIMDTPDGGHDVIMNSNYFVNKVLPTAVMRRLSDEEMAHYQEPFKNPGSCKPLWQFIQEWPLGTGPTTVDALMKEYSVWLEQTQIPKLMIFAIPGLNTSMDTVQWAKENLKNMDQVTIEDALHFAQETHPHEIGEAIGQWCTKLKT